MTEHDDRAWASLCAVQTLCISALAEVRAAGAVVEDRETLGRLGDGDVLVAALGDRGAVARLGPLNLFSP